MPINITTNSTIIQSVANSSSYTTFMQGVNTHMMGGGLGVIFLLIIVSIAYIQFMFSTRDAKKAFAGACFIATGTSLLLLIIGILNVWWFFISAVLTAVSVALLNTS